MIDSSTNSINAQKWNSPLNSNTVPLSPCVVSVVVVVVVVAVVAVIGAVYVVVVAVISAPGIGASLVGVAS